jgi:hypothetical protein
MYAQNDTHVLRLMDEQYTPEEAAEIIETMVSDRIKLDKVRMLRQWEYDHSANFTTNGNQFSAIKAQRQQAQSLLETAKSLGYRVEFKANIEVRLVK